ncbi:MAG: PaaI family thioesterase [Candidatus Sericytochromatia bacterium]
MSPLPPTNPLSAEECQEMARLWNANPVLQMMGVKIDLSSPDAIRARIDPLLPQHRGGLGSDAVNGAVISGLFDLMIGLVGIVNSQKHRTGTVQLNIQFVRPLRGAVLLAESRLTKAGKALVFARSEIRDQAGNICASCEGIASVDFDKPPVENYMAV